MTTIDEIGRSAAADLRTEVGPLVDLAGGLDRIRAATEVVPSRSRQLSPRLWIGLASAAAVIVAVVAIVAVRDDHHRTITVVPGSGLDTTSPSAVTTPATTAPSAPSPSDSTTDPTSPSTVASTVVTTPPAPAVTVSSKNPPPLFTPRVFASGQLAPPAGPGFQGQPPVAVGEVAVTSTGVVVVDSIAKTADIIDWSGKRTASVSLLDVVPTSIVAGPGDVLYGLAPTTDGFGLRMVAIALTGPSTGRIVESADVGAATYTELPIGAFGHGPLGVIDRVRDIGAQVIPYVDASGQPVELDGTRDVTIDAENTVRMDGGPTWPLDIERDPTSPGSYNGLTPPAPSANGGAVYWTSIGPPSSPETSGGDAVATMPVVAALYADGSAQWWSLPDVWFVAASEQWGTVLARATPNSFDLALFPDDAGRFPSATGTTAPTTTARPSPCVSPDGVTIAGPIAGTQLIIVSTTSVTGPVIGEVQRGGDSPAAAVLGPIAISADDSTIAAAIDRKGPDDIVVSRDRGATWTTIGSSPDATHLTLDDDGNALAVSTPNTITLYTFGAATEHRVIALPSGSTAVDALAFSGRGVMVAALEDGNAGSEFATPGHIQLFDFSTNRWTKAPDTPTGPVLITSLVATSTEISYLAIDASANSSGNGVAELWRIHADNSVTLQTDSLPSTDTLVGYTGPSTVLLGEYDDTGTYRIVQRGGGDQLLTLGCLRPAAGVDLVNGDPDLR